jgi:antitoxin (DNA-binding transcriptional repressor) of toxin-antitoxin stability system
MKTISVGAFEAKTHLSQLLDEVERGAVVKISRRGKPVAILKQDETVSREKALNALSQIRTLCGNKASMDEITQLRDAGRER